MNIMKRLETQIPKCRQSNHLNPIYKLTKEFMDEIDEARKLGYSWGQVCAAVAEEAKEQGRWSADWNQNRIQDIYRMIRKEVETV